MILQVVKNAMNFPTFSRPIWWRWANRCKSTDKCASKLALAFGLLWHGLPFEMSLADVMRQDARWKSLAGHWYGWGYGLQATLPAIYLLSSFVQNALLAFQPYVIHSRSTFWDSIFVHFPAMASKNSRGGLENCLAPLKIKTWNLKITHLKSGKSSERETFMIVGSSH